jgi:hypothetical protein
MHPPQRSNAQLQIKSYIRSVDTTSIFETDSVKILLDSALDNRESITNNVTGMLGITNTIKNQAEIIYRQNEIIDSLERTSK